MAQGPVSRQELIRQRRSGGFVGRRRELAVFWENLARTPGSDGYQFLFHVHGLAGVGKSTLIRRWESVTRQAGRVTAVVGEEAHSAIEAMETVSARLAGQGCPLKSFDKQLAVYRQKCHEAEAAAAVPLPGDESGGATLTASATSTIIAQIGMAGLALVPGASALSGAVRTDQMAAGLDRARATVGSRLRSHEDVRLVLSPLKVLTPYFLADLSEVAERRPWVVVFFDTYERTAPMLDAWLRDVLVTEAYGAVPVNVQTVLSGQGRLNAACWEDSLDLIDEIPLEPFTEDESRALLAAQGITDERVTDLILRLSGRLPVLLDALARSRPQDVDAVGDPSGTAVERFLRWERDPLHRNTILACAYPLRIDDDIYRVLAPAAADDDGLRRLRDLPFLTGQPGQYRYHDVIRSSMLRLQRSHSPADWRRRHTELAGAFAAWRREQEDLIGPNGRWDDPVWHDHLLNESYHLLCAQTPDAQPEALHNTVCASAHSAESLRRWAQLLVQAGQDSATDDLTRTGQRLLELSNQPSGKAAALTVLLSLPALGERGQALAYALRGQDHRLERRHDQALEDYTTALSLNPDLTRAYAGRGHTHTQMRHYQAAFNDYDQAVRIAPDNPLYLVNRGSGRLNLRLYDDALEDFDRALALDRSSVRAATFRGLTYHRMHRHRAALADFTSALTLNPDYAWAYAARGDVHLSLGHTETALTDLDRSLALEPDAAWPRCWRGETHRALGHHAQALADFEHAIALRPECGWFHYQSALVMRLTGAPAQNERWRRARVIYEAQAAAEDGGDLARSNLLVVLCALPDWEGAESQLELFLSCSPSWHQIREAIDDLEDLRRAVFVDTQRLTPILGRLRGALQRG
ncbi:tetratricopeptide repeat protein [Streptomyces sp. NPDC005329]|uniref:tetratricopeptide repeat protein n=1 Tax=Streptomyces sp. NPDC005329 TaxID=3157034 RepID=UPI0033A21C6E